MRYDLLPVQPLHGRAAGMADWLAQLFMSGWSKTNGTITFHLYTCDHLQTGVLTEIGTGYDLQGTGTSWHWSSAWRAGRRITVYVGLVERTSIVATRLQTLHAQFEHRRALDAGRDRTYDLTSVLFNEWQGCGMAVAQGIHVYAGLG